jgi:hypothetical protein
MNNHGHGEMHMDGYPLWELVFGFHIDFALVLLAVSTGTEEEKLIKKKESYGILFQ